MTLPTTPLPEFEAAKLVLALAPEFLPGIGREGARLILAHGWGLETSRGQKSYGHSIGNLGAAWLRDGKETFSQASDTWGGDYWRPPWFSDPTDPRHAKMLKGEAPSAFRAYPSFQDGMRDYLKLISRTAVGKGALDGRAFEFARGVWDSGYCRDASCSPTILERSLKDLSHEFSKKGYFESLPSTVTSRGVGMVGALAVAGVAGFIFWGTLREGKKS